MKQTFTVYFSKKTSSARLDLRVNFDNYDEMSDSVREAFAAGEAENEIEKITLRHTQHYYFNYLYLLGNLIDSENPFEYFKDLFISTSETNSKFFAYQLANAEKDYTEYIQHNNFSKEFFDIYANSKRITLNRKLFEVVNKHFVPLRIDSKTDDIFYSYESTDIKDIIFASIHFAVENGYKLSKCKHCGKWFFVQSLKETYCARKSTYPEYERYTCKEAVKKIKDKLEKKRISEYERLRLKANEYGSNSKHFQIWSDFCNTCTDYKERLKNNSGVDLLQEYERYLYDSKNVRKKYERIKEQKKGRWK